MEDQKNKERFPELPFDVEFNHLEKSNWTITITNNEERYSLRDCLKLMISRMIYNEAIDGKLF